MGAKASFEKGAKVLVKVSDGRGGHTLQAGTVKDTAGKGAVVRFTNGGHERFVFATDISPDTTEPVKPAEKVKAPAHFAEKPKPTIGQLFRAERVSRELTIEDVASLLGIHQNALKEIEAEQDLPGDDLVLKFIDVIGANLGALVEASDRARLTPPRYSPGLVNIPPVAAAALPAPVITHMKVGPRETPPLDAWVARLRKLTEAVGRSPASNVVITHRAGCKEGEWKVEIGADYSTGESSDATMAKLMGTLSESVQARIAARRKELAELESLSAATR